MRIECARLFAVSGSLHSLLIPASDTPSKRTLSWWVKALPGPGVAEQQGWPGSVLPKQEALRATEKPKELEKVLERGCVQRRFCRSRWEGEVNSAPGLWGEECEQAQGQALSPL